MPVSFVHFDGKTGDIVQIINTAATAFECPFKKDARIGYFDRVGLTPQHKVDLTMLWELENGHCIVKRFINPDTGPTIDQIKALRDAELIHTDSYVSVPPDRPVDWSVDEYKAYRQKLRDLGKITTAKKMLAAFPKRPDGLDAAAPLRS